MEHNIYKVTLKHDKGTISIITAATSKEKAIEIVTNAERAPRSAVKKVEQKSK